MRYLSSDHFDRILRSVEDEFGSYGVRRAPMNIPRPMNIRLRSPPGVLAQPACVTVLLRIRDELIETCAAIDVQCEHFLQVQHDGSASICGREPTAPRARPLRRKGHEQPN